MVRAHRVYRISPAEDHILSAGPCQFPTLGFVVSRYNQVKSFVPEPFWYIYVALSREDEVTGEEVETPFTWRRGHLFDFDVALAIYEHVLDNPVARVTKVVNKNTKKWKPLPLTTVDLQKAGSRLLKISPKKVLDVWSFFLHTYRQSTDGLADSGRAVPTWIFVIPAYRDRPV